MGLKAICMFLLFWWHSSIPSPKTDLGARTCEFLFVTSGFLVGYNYYDKNVSATWKQSFKYLYEKLIEFWPLHILAMIMVWITCVTPIFTWKNVFNAFLNGLLIQAWSPSTQVSFSFNGASWYLSALMFCYFISPFLLSISKKIKISVVLFLIVLLSRCIIEYTINSNPDFYTGLNIHTSPIIRSMEYFLGMLMVSVFMYCREHFARKINFFVASLIEIAYLFLLIYLIIYKDGVWLRGQFVALMCLAVFIFSFDKGFVSKLLSNKLLRVFSGIQFEFFILHQAVIKCLDNIYSKYISEPLLRSMVIFLIILLFATIYHYILKKHISGKLGKVLEVLKKFFNG